MTEPLSPEISSWLQHSAAVTGSTYSRVMLHLLERMEALEKKYETNVPAAPEAAPVDLPPNYIDPEHQGKDLELLRVFCQACWAEGGTADEMCLRGIRAVLAVRPAAPPAAPVGELLRQHDESFRNGSIAVVESMEDALNGWQFQLLIRIVPRWTLRKFRERISDLLPLLQTGEAK